MRDEKRFTRMIEILNSIHQQPKIFLIRIGQHIRHHRDEATDPPVDKGVF